MGGGVNEGTHTHSHGNTVTSASAPPRAAAAAARTSSRLALLASTQQFQVPAAPPQPRPTRAFVACAVSHLKPAA